MAARKMLAPRMCLNGLIEQKDTSGLEIHALAQSSIVPELHSVDTPNPLIQDMVAVSYTHLTLPTICSV